MECKQCGATNPDGQKFCGTCGAPLDGSPRRATPPPLPGKRTPGGPGLALDDVYASFLRRFAAAMVDGALLFVVFGVIGVIRGAGGASGGVSGLGLVAAWAYHALMESSSRQATLGKMALGIKVCSLDGERIGLGRATGRYFGSWLSALLLSVGFLMAAFTQKRQALHDLMAKTLVVRAAADEEDVRNAETPRGGAVVAIVLAFGGIVLVGMLAGIVIPAYQDFTIRAQVSEGLVASSGAKASIAAALAARRDPATVSSSSLDFKSPPDLTYVDEIAVEQSIIVVTFGATAHPMLAGKRLALVPAVSSNGEVQWVCGRALPATGFTPVVPNPQRLTDVPTKYLPKACRD